MLCNVSAALGPHLSIASCGFLPRAAEELQCCTSHVWAAQECCCERARTHLLWLCDVAGLCQHGALRFVLQELLMCLAAMISTAGTDDYAVPQLQKLTG